MAEKPLGKSKAEKDVGTDLGCAGFLVVIGALGLLIPLVQWIRGIISDGFGTINFWGWIGLGLGGLSVMFGLWCAYNSVVSARQAKRDRLQKAFYHLLDTQNSQFTVLDFARLTQLPGDEAKQYLDQRAQEFGATFDLASEGGIVYRFK